MTDTFFVDRQTPIQASWLNDINTAVYKQAQNVKLYGVNGDGVTNNLQALLSMSSSITSNSAWYFPAGTYIVDFNDYVPTVPNTLGAVISLVNKQNVLFYGDGTSTKIILKNLNTTVSSGMSLFKLSSGCSDISFKNIWLDMRPCTGVAAYTANYPRYMGIMGLSCSRLKIEGCKFTSYNPSGSGPTNDGGVSFLYKQIPVYTDGSTSQDSVRGFDFINNIVGDGPSDMNTYKLFILAVGDVKITGNRFLNISGVYPTIRNLVYTSNDHLIANNYFEQISPLDQDIPNNVIYNDTPAMVWHSNFNGGGGVTVVNNNFNLTGGGGVLFEGSGGTTTFGVVVTGNQFKDRIDMSSYLTVEANNQSCIHFSSLIEVNNFTISNNTVRGLSSRKFADIQNALNGNISGNTTDSSAAYALKGVGLRNTIVSNNVFTDVSLLGTAQSPILVNCANIGTGETCTVTNNVLKGSAGIGIVFVSYSSAKLFLSGNRIYGGITPIQTGSSVFQNDISVGIFTPTVIGTTTAGVGTYTTQIGRYQLIGNRCTFQIYLSWSAHTGTGNMRIDGLPFTSINTPNVNTAISIWENNISATTGHVLQGLVLPNGVQVSLYQYPTGGGSTTLLPIDIAGDIAITGTYEINVA